MKDHFDEKYPHIYQNANSIFYKRMSQGEYVPTKEQKFADDWERKKRRVERQAYDKHILGITAPEVAALTSAYDEKKYGPLNVDTAHLTDSWSKYIDKS